MNIASIDIDFLFNCNEYSKLVNYNIDPSKAWDMVYAYGINPVPHSGVLCKLLELLELKVGKNTIVRVIEEHDDIVPLMEELKCKDASVYNFDYHHDLGYGEDDCELDLSNWVKHAKDKELINEYHWIHRPLSDLRYTSPFYHTRTCFTDLIWDNIPELDVVVICVSKQYTPKTYWKSMVDLLLSYMNTELKYFIEVNRCAYNPILWKNKPDFLLDGTLPNVERLFKYRDCYIVHESEGNSLSIINEGEGFGISVCKEVSDLIIKDYGYCSFTWKKGIRNEVLINRLIRNYNVISKIDNGECITIKLNFKL